MKLSHSGVACRFARNRLGTAASGSSLSVSQNRQGWNGSRRQLPQSRIVLEVLHSLTPQSHYQLR
jgi:hypothetical protein